MSGLYHPDRVQWHRDAENGCYPAVQVYGRAIGAENYLMLRQGKQWISRSWQPGVGTGGSSGTTNKVRFRRRSSHGARRLQVIIRLTKTLATGAPSPPTPYVELDVVDAGGTTTVGPIYYGLTAGTVTDAPSDWYIAVREIDIDPNTVYTCNLRCVDYARVLSLMVREISDGTIDGSVDYFNTYVAQGDSPIYDASPHERLLLGLSNMWRQNAGGGRDYAREAGTARTRSSAVYANLDDAATTGAPTNATRGFWLDNTYRRRYSKTTVRYELAVYGAMSAGGGVSGNVKLMDTAGNSYGPVVVTNNLADWFPTTVDLPADARKYDFQFAGDGANTLSVYAVSLAEWLAP